ncbi:blue copper protein 1b-like [Bidens hawaiensis]|uniref:blue copper protein 1b-like n=1 Tax=Bidens hawaiensis TaxID=980011 RepID=UPI0040495B19
MAFFNHIMVVMTILVVILLPTATTATEYVVGDDIGWTTQYDYQAWAKDKNFKVVFNYHKDMHNVFKVNGTVFANCIIPPPSQAYTSGHDVIELSTPVKTWFICGVGVHCSAFNQKLAIDVKA